MAGIFENQIWLYLRLYLTTEGYLIAYAKMLFLVIDRRSINNTGL